MKELVAKVTPSGSSIKNDNPWLALVSPIVLITFSNELDEGVLEEWKRIILLELADIVQTNSIGNPALEDAICKAVCDSVVNKAPPNVILFKSTKVILEVISPLENGKRPLPSSIDEVNKRWVASAVNVFSEFWAVETDKDAVIPFITNWSSENPSPVDEVTAAWLPVNAIPIDAVSITSKWNPKLVPLVINPKWLWDNWRCPSDPV